MTTLTKRRIITLPKLMKWGFWVILATIAVLWTTNLSYASIPGEGLTISPPLVERTVKVGEVLDQTIKITNPTSTTMEVFPQVLNFEARGDGGEPTFYAASDEDKKYALANWVTFDQTKIALTPEQNVEFHFQIKVPEGAEPGGHYGALFFSSDPPKLESTVNQVSIGSMVGSLVLVKVPGAILEEGNVAEFSSKKLYLKPPVNLTTRIANTGNIHIKPKGDITITNWRGEVMEKIKFNQVDGNILPDSTRKFVEKWSPATSFFLVPAGRFTATLNAAFGEESSPLNGVITFWVIPLWLIIIAGAVLIIIVWLILSIRARRKKGRSVPSEVDTREPTPVLVEPPVEDAAPPVVPPVDDTEKDDRPTESYVPVEPPVEDVKPLVAPSVNPPVEDAAPPVVPPVEDAAPPVVPPVEEAAPPVVPPVEDVKPPVDDTKKDDRPKKSQESRGSKRGKKTGK